MSDHPTEVLEQLFAALDRQDPDSILGLLAPDAVMVDEISRRWLRGLDAVASQLRTVLSATASVESRLSDLHHQPIAADAVLVTGWLDQTYSLNGTTEVIAAPLSACLEASAGSWRVVSLHAIPLSAAQS